MNINYRERGQKVANEYRLSVINLNTPTLDLAQLIAEELKTVAREARKEVRKQYKDKKIHVELENCG